MNREWHQSHVLGQHATQEERIVWHEEHARECACRPVPEPLAADVAALAAARGAAAGDSARVVPGNTAP